MVVTVGLDRLERFGFDRHLADGAADHPAAEIAGPQHQRGSTVERLERAGPAEDDELEPAIGRVDRLARTDPARDQLAGVRHEDEVAGDLDRLAVGHDPEVRRLERVNSRTAAPTYAPNCSRRFHSCSAAAMTRASRPIPQATVKSRSWGVGLPRRTAVDLPPARPPEVQAPRSSGPDDVETRPHAADAEGACQDVAGPGGDDRDRRLATEQRGGGLADGPVAADDHDERRRRVDRQGRPGRLDGPLLDLRRDAEPMLDRAAVTP